jgi:hypothetical protein
LFGICPLEVLSKSLVQSRIVYENDPFHYPDIRGNTNIYILRCKSVKTLAPKDEKDR